MTVAGFCGLSTPGLTLAGGYGAHEPWETNAGPQDFLDIARAADRLGFDHLTCSEHVGIPPEVEAVRGGRYYDPLSTFGFMAAVTERVRFLTYVLVLGYSHPLEIAKRYGTLDRLSGGRLVLGMGVGSLKPEFDLLGMGGEEFANRGARADDALKALRASFAKRMPEYHGPYYDFANFIIDPCGVQEHVPIWIGGRSARSLRRAVELGDGWAPFGLGEAELGAMIAKAREHDSWHQRDKPLECALAHEGRLDPLGQPDLTVDRLAGLLELGATKVVVNVNHSSPSHYLEQLEALASLRL